MKKLFFYSTAFLMAAIFGLGIAVTTADTAYAGDCQEGEEYWQYYWDCYSPLCGRYPHAWFKCGTDDVTGEPCNCVFQGCSKWCVVEA